MLFKTAVTLSCAALLLGMSGCKIVYDTPEDDKSIPADASGDDARNALRLSKTFDAQLIPYIRNNALSVQDLRVAINGGLDAAGAGHGTQGSGRGAAWNFPVKGQGKVIEAKLNSRARNAQLDTDGDGAADVTIQLGPVIKGTAVRDVAPFFSFDDFRDQIEFAKLSRAINNRVSSLIEVPEGALTGSTMSFTGVVPLKKPDGKYLITAIEIGVSP